MASVFKQTQRKPIPKGSTVTESEKPIPKSARIKDGVASWTDRNGCKRTAAVIGNLAVMRFASWENAAGNERTAPIDHTGEAVLVVDQYWQAAFRDAHGRRQRRSTKTTDKAAAQRIAAKWESDAQLLAEGVTDDEARNLAVYSAQPIAEHADAFIAQRATKGGTAKHRDRMRKHIDEFAAAGDWKTIRDINADDVAAHVATLKESGKSTRTIQGRLQSIKSFTRWLANSHRLRLNPLSMVSKPDPRSDRRHERRMLLPDEWTWLVAALERAEGVVNGMEPAERLILYRTAIQTGLRAGELGKLTRGKLVLESETPHILCKAAGTKNKKPAKQYIDPALAGDLAAHAERKHPKAPVFGIASKEELSDTIERDLVLARTRWLKSLSGKERIAAEESDFLSRVNHENEILVFHSLRHTCGAWLAIAGEHPKTVQTVMRHGTITLTMDTYGHLFPGQTEQAPIKLAAMMAGTLRPTGVQ